MENRTDSLRSSHTTTETTGSLAGLPRIQDGLDFVKRWEANVLLNGLISGSRAHRILLEVVRRIANDRPKNMDAAFERLSELQSFLNAMEHPITGTAAIDPKDLVLAFEHAKAAIMHTEPWHGPSRWRQKHATQRPLPRAVAHVHVVHGAR